MCESCGNTSVVLDCFGLWFAARTSTIQQKRPVSLLSQRERK